jgi:phosphocarrier protein
MTARSGAPDDHASTEPEPPADAVWRDLAINNKRGLHARAAAKLVQTVEQFRAEVTVSRGGETVGGTSIMGILMLAAAPGTLIRVTARGPEAKAALDAVSALIEGKFGEDE